MSWATWLLFTGVPARCVVLPARCPGPLGSCSPVCPFGALLCVCGVLGHLAPVHWCVRLVSCVACAVSWATWLLFTGVSAGCVAFLLPCHRLLGSCSPVCPLGVWCGVCGVLRHVAPVHRSARSVLCFDGAVSSATWLLFTGVPAGSVVLRVRCPGPLGSCSPVCPLCVLCCVCGVLGLLAPVYRCARSVCCVACTASWATWLLFTGLLARCAVLGVRCPGPLDSCSPVCSLRVLCCWLRVRGVAAGRTLAHPDDTVRSRQGLGSLPGAHSSIQTAAVRSRQGLGTLRARTRPSGRWLFVVGRGWVPCQARTRPSGRQLVLLGTCSRAVVRCVLCALSGFAAPGGRCCLAPVRVPWLWPAPRLSGVPPGTAWCAARRPVRSLSVLRSAFPTPWCLSPHQGLAPPSLLGGCAGHAEAAPEQLNEV